MRERRERREMRERREGREGREREGRGGREKGDEGERRERREREGRGGKQTNNTRPPSPFPQTSTSQYINTDLGVDLWPMAAASSTLVRLLTLDITAGSTPRSNVDGRPVFHTRNG